MQPPEDLVPIFQANVKRALKVRGLKQVDLARLLGMSRPSITVLLNHADQWRPGLDTVAKVAAALEISPATVLLLPRSDLDTEADPCESSQ